MKFNIYSLDYQQIYGNSYGVVHISVAIPINEFKSDCVIRYNPKKDEIRWHMDKWYHHRGIKKKGVVLVNERWLAGIGDLNERS